jgi:Ser/Thr protein kinase RdoA (MazF antagonist)
MTIAAQPFAALTPQCVLDAAAAVGIDGDGRLLALNSYENRVYRLGTAGAGAWVLKFYRPQRWSVAQIAEEHSFTLSLAERELPVAAPLVIGGDTLFSHAGFRFAVFPCLPGRAPELDSPDALTLLGRTLARIHAVGALRGFEARPALNLERFGRRARADILAGRFVPESLRASYESASDHLLGVIEREFDSVGAVPMIRVHGDCHLGNILWNDRGPVFVDLDDCALAPRVQDLWMFLSGDAGAQQSAWARLIEGYEEFGRLDYCELRLIEPLRGLRMLHHAAWIGGRWHDPAFPRAFPWFGEPRYWESHIGDLLDQIASIEDPPILRR